MIVLINFCNDKNDAADDNRKNDENNDDLFMHVKIDVIKRRSPKILIIVSTKLGFRPVHSIA